MIPADRALGEVVLQVRAPAVCFYVLRDEHGLYVVDGGFIGGLNLLRNTLRKHGWSTQPIRGILLTHGHLDHVWNVAKLASETGAWIAAPRLDADHYLGNYRYTGTSRVCGVLEKAGRLLLGYETFSVTQWLDEGSVLPIWHGLETIHLPGHTDGHSGFYCPKLKLLFCADLFACYGPISHLPPNIFNSHPENIPGSVHKALTLDLEGVLPNHCDRSLPSTHLQSLRKLAVRL